MTHTPPQDRRPIVISGPSGVGKGTLCQMLLDHHPSIFTTTVSHTTRAPRAGEVEGKSYFFISAQSFTELLSQNRFVEHTVFSDNYCGTSVQSITDQMAKGLSVIVEIDVRGVWQMEAGSAIDARYILIQPPSFQALEERLRGRGSENEEQIQKRLKQAQEDLAHTDIFDKMIVNDGLEEAYRELEDYIWQVKVESEN